MRREQFESLLRELQRARSKRAAVCALDGLRTVATQPWFDADCGQHLAQACHRAQVTPPDLTLRPLAVGEAWLLLFSPRERAGMMTRLRANERWAALDDNGCLHELQQAYVGLAAALARRGRAVPSELKPRSIVLDEQEVFGASLGLAACLAWMSRALNRPLPAAIAATAAVQADGSLRRVSHLREKVAALRRSRPEVTQVLVASDQPDTELVGIRLLRAAAVEDALDMCGLAPEELPGLDEDASYTALEAFKRIEQRECSTQEWGEHACAALELEQVLRVHFQEPEHARQCLRWGALFALHGGNPGLAEEILSRLPREELVGTELGAWHAILTASLHIDRDPALAVGLAESAVAACEGTDAGRTRTELLARARGTQGRALVHAGRPDAGEPHLRRALAENIAVAPREAPRSACYLAQSLRIQGRAEEALSECERALERTRGRVGTYERKTMLFLELERGRALLALGRATEAVSAFELVACGQSRDEDYPRLAALRGLAAAHRRVGNPRRSEEFLAACAAVARRVQPPLRDVAAAAIAEAVLDGATIAEPARMASIWLDCYAEPLTIESCAGRLRRVVY